MDGVLEVDIDMYFWEVDVSFLTLSLCTAAK